MGRVSRIADSIRIRYNQTCKIVVRETRNDKKKPRININNNNTWRTKVSIPEANKFGTGINVGI